MPRALDQVFPPWAAFLTSWVSAHIAPSQGPPYFTLQPAFPVTPPQAPLAPSPSSFISFSVVIIVL